MRDASTRSFPIQHNLETGEITTEARRTRGITEQPSRNEETKAVHVHVNDHVNDHVDVHVDVVVDVDVNVFSGGLAAP